jgi:hypothetical protein
MITAPRAPFADVLDQVDAGVGADTLLSNEHVLASEGRRVPSHREIYGAPTVHRKIGQQSEAIAI